MSRVYESYLCYREVHLDFCAKIRWEVCSYNVEYEHWSSNVSASGPHCANEEAHKACRSSSKRVHISIFAQQMPGPWPVRETVIHTRAACNSSSGPISRGALSEKTSSKMRKHIFLFLLSFSAFFFVCFCVVRFPFFSAIRVALLAVGCRCSSGPS